MSEHEDEALVLRVLDFRDRDCILHLLTRERGHKSGVLFGAKSPRSRNRAVAEPFVRARVHYSERHAHEMVKFRSLELISSQGTLRQNYARLLHASYLAELLLLLEIPEPDAPVLFQWLEQHWYALGAGKAPAEVKLQAEGRLLQQLGVLPDWQHCLECGRSVPTADAPEPVEVPDLLHQVDAAEGGVRCPRCVRRHPAVAVLSPGTLRWLQKKPFTDALPPVTALQLRELHRALFLLLRAQLSREPKSHALLPLP